jgi:SAM-dependent methyltransferase
MPIVSSLHESLVHGRRIHCLERHLLALIPERADVIDVGSGDGQLLARIAESRPDCTMRGLDVLIRLRAHERILPFDGRHIPIHDKGTDVVMFIDVLHHTDDPEVLLREARRVARRMIIVKDHSCDGAFARPTLRFMDWVGNAHHGVALPYNYWTSEQWKQAFSRLGVIVESWNTRLQIYPHFADWIFGRSLHFIAVLRPREADA